MVNDPGCEYPMTYVLCKPCRENDYSQAPGDHCTCGYAMSGLPFPPAAGLLTVTVGTASAQPRKLADLYDDFSLPLLPRWRWLGTRWLLRGILYRLRWSWVPRNVALFAKLLWWRLRDWANPEREVRLWWWKRRHRR